VIWLFKLSGFTLIILTTYIAGYLKSNSLNLRRKKLIAIKSAINDLKQRIRLSHTEIDKLISVSFKDILDIYSNLEKRDIEIIKDFFNDIGMSDSKAEYERCEVYISLLNTQIAEAEKNYTDLSKLYKSIGFLSGIFICIFFL
jgi:hypothetical protein